MMQGRSNRVQAVTDRLRGLTALNLISTAEIGPGVWQNCAHHECEVEKGRLPLDISNTFP